MSRGVKEIILAVLVGFLLGAVTAGVLEGLGVEKIEFESTLAVVLIAFWTVLAWVYLSRRN